MSGAASDQQHPVSAAEPLVSVIIPVHNEEMLLGDTIESALCQTYRNLEIIVVDDGSTDGTAEVVEAYAAHDPRIRLIRQSNAGVARARNRGLSEARGEFIAPLDSDDMWDPRKIELQVERFRESGDDTGMVYCWWVWIDNRGTILDRSPGWRVEGRSTLPFLLQVNYTGNASVPLYRRRCIEDVGGYDEELIEKDAQGCEDWDLALKIAARYEVAVVPALLTAYRRSQGRMSMNYETMWRSQTLVAEGARKRAGLSPALSRRSADQFALYIAGGQFWSGNYPQAFVWALRAWRSGLLFAVLPYILKVLCGNLPRGRASHGLMMKPGMPLDPDKISGPLIPYDRIHSPDVPMPRDVPGGDGARKVLTSDDRVTAWLRSPFWQVAAVIIGFLAITIPHFANDGLWHGGDAPRHAANGLFWWDLLQLRPSAPLDFARSYYARYPVINPVTYPPLFYLLEGLAFHLFGPFPIVAKCLIFLFAVMLGLYTMAWARRWLGPEMGWAGAFVAFLPGIVGVTNSIMLNIPSTAFVIACLYHFRRWTESGGRKHLTACILAACAAALSYYQGGIAVCLCIAWTFLFQQRQARGVRTVSWIPVAVVIAVIPPVLAFRLAPGFAARHLPTLATLTRPAAWAFYFANLPALVGKVALFVGLAGIVAGFLDRDMRKEVAYVGSWILIPILCFSLLPAKDSRYVLLLAPAFVLAVAMGIASAIRILPPIRPELIAVMLVVVFAAGALSAVSMPVPVKSGMREAAVYLQEHAPADAVLYDGYNDGLFAFYVRALDPGFQRRVVFAQELLYHYGPGKTFQWIEQSNAASTDDVVKLVRTRSGCRWIAIEVGPYSEWAQGQRLLRQAVLRSDFEMVRSFPVTSTGTVRIDLYRVVGPVSPVVAVDLKYLPFTNRVPAPMEPVVR